MAKVFIVEDDYQSRVLFEDILKMLGHHCESVGHPASAVDQIIRYQPDLVLLDLALPGGISGMDICQQLRQHADFVHTPIIAVTAAPSQHKMNTAMAIGFSGYFVKPVLPATLRKILSQYLSDAATG